MPVEPRLRLPETRKPITPKRIACFAKLIDLKYTAKSKMDITPTILIRNGQTTPAKSGDCDIYVSLPKIAHSVSPVSGAKITDSISSKTDYFCAPILCFELRNQFKS